MFKTNIDITSITTTKNRSIEPELVCQNAWDLLEFDKALKKCDFSLNDVALAKAVIFGRLISPGSEHHTIKWFRKHSSLSEFPGVDASEYGKDRFYEIGDIIYGSSPQTVGSKHAKG